MSPTHLSELHFMVGSTSRAPRGFFDVHAKMDSMRAEATAEHNAGPDRYFRRGAVRC